jgi:hypothetical protein
MVTIEEIQQTTLSLFTWLWGNSPTLESPLLGYIKDNNNPTDQLDLVEAVAYLEGKFNVILDDAGIFNHVTIDDLCRDIHLTLLTK